MLATRKKALRAKKPTKSKAKASSKTLIKRKAPMESSSLEEILARVVA